jgi:hypothetical protein
MKLRIKDNSIRLRLTRTEITQLASDGAVAGATDFGGATFRYLAETRPQVHSLSAQFEQSVIRVLIPASLAASWAAGNDVGLYADQALPNGEALKISVEKDFRCLDPNRDEDESDHFENPLAGVGHGAGCAGE